MNSVFHLALKDLRHSRWLIALTWIVAAAILWLPTLPVDSRDQEFFRFHLYGFGSWVLLFLTIGSIVQLDAPLRDTAFLRSRPVSHGDWLASKFLAVLFVIFPMALFPVSMILVAGLRPGLIHLSLAFVEEMLTLGMIAAFAMTIAARNQTPSKFIANVMALALSAFIVFIIFVKMMGASIPRMMDYEWCSDLYHRSLSRFLAAQGIALAGFAAAMLHFFRNRHRGHLTCATIGTVLAAILGACFWPLNFVKWFAPAEAEAPRSEWPDPSKIIFKFGQNPSAPEDETALVMNSDRSEDGRSMGYSFRANTYLSGLPNGWLVCEDGFDSTITFVDQRKFQSHGDPWPGLEARMILPRFGIPNPVHSGDDSLLASTRLGSFNVDESEVVTRGATLAGSVNIPFRRPVILARMPLRAGAETIIGSRKIRILRVKVSDTRLSYQYSIEEPMVRFLGGSMSEPFRMLETIVVNASKRQRILFEGSSGGNGLSVGPYRLAIIECLGPISLDTRDEVPIPADWIEGAELIITGSEYGGALIREFQFKPVDLKEMPWQR